MCVCWLCMGGLLEVLMINKMSLLEEGGGGVGGEGVKGIICFI